MRFDYNFPHWKSPKIKLTNTLMLPRCHVLHQYCDAVIRPCNQAFLCFQGCEYFADVFLTIVLLKSSEGVIFSHVNLKLNRKEWAHAVTEEPVRLLLLLNAAACIMQRGIPAPGIKLD